MKAISPQSIDGDHLNLVHLSNGFRMLDGASPLRVGDVVKTEAKIASNINTDAGKAVEVIGNVIHEGKPVIEIASSFLYRGHFTDYENTFKIVQEPDYVVEYPIDASIGALLSKEWFKLRDQSKPLTASTSIIFRLKSEITFKSKVSHHSVAVSGDVYVCDKVLTCLPTFPHLVPVSQNHIASSPSRNARKPLHVLRHFNLPLGTEIRDFPLARTGGLPIPLIFVLHPTQQSVLPRRSMFPNAPEN